MKTLPEDTETERSLLSTICAAGAEAVAAECCAVLREDDFMHPAHREVFRALMAVLDAGDEVSSITLAAALDRSKRLDKVGGRSGLLEIVGAEEVGRPMALVDILQRLRKYRDLVKLGWHMSQQAVDAIDSPEAITEAAGAELSRISMEQDRKGIRNLADFSDDALAHLQDEMNGVQTAGTWLKGWSLVNSMLGGFKSGELITLAARPGIGKSALALNWALAASEYRKSIGIFSLEMSAPAMWRRMVAAHAGVNIREMVQSHNWNAFNQLGQAKQELDERGIWIQDRAGITPREILGEVDGLISRQPNLGLLVIDHLGLVTSQDGGSSRKSEATRIGEITRAFKILAKDRNIPVLMLVQMNREIEKRGAAARPQLSDLRDSGCIEQDSDVVLFIHRRMDSPSAELIIAKQREGPTGTIGLLFDAGTTRYRETERETRPIPGYQPEMLEEFAS